MMNDPQIPPPVSLKPQWILASSLVRYLVSQTLPLSQALKNSDQLKQIAQEIRRAVSASEVSLPAATKGHTLTAVGTLMYWLGFYAGYTVAPVLGLAIVLLGSAGISAGYKCTCEAWRNFGFLQLYYSCLLLMQNADRIVTDQERRIMDEFLLSLELSELEKAKLRNMKTPTLESIEIPDWVDADQRKSILSGCWSLVYCDGVSPVEEDFFNRLANRFQVSVEEAEALKKQAMQLVNRQEEKLLKLGTWVQALIGPGNLPHPILEVITQTSFKVSHREALMEALQKPEHLCAPEIPLEANAAQFLLAGAGLLEMLLTHESDPSSPVMHEKLSALGRQAGKELELDDFRTLCGELFRMMTE